MTDSAEKYDGKFIELNVVEAALDGNDPAIRSILARMTATERRELIKAFNLVVDTMGTVEPEQL